MTHPKPIATDAVDPTHGSSSDEQDASGPAVSTRMHTRTADYHRAALARLTTKKAAILYALEHLPRGVSIEELRSWLEAHGASPPARTYASPIVNEWRARNGLTDTGGNPLLTPELLAELDAANAATHDAASKRALTDPASPGENAPLALDQTRTGRTHAPVEDNRAVRALRWVSAARDELDATRRPDKTAAVTGSAGKVWAWLAFLLGAVFSVVANIVSTMHPTREFMATWLLANPGKQATDFSPDPVALAFGVFWPLAVLLAIELLTRVHWQPGVLFGLVRYGATLAVAVVAGVVSYGHMRDLFLAWGQDTLTAYAGPLAVDGLMLVAAAALLSIAKGRAAAQARTTHT